MMEAGRGKGMLWLTDYEKMKLGKMEERSEEHDSESENGSGTDVEGKDK